MSMLALAVEIARVIENADLKQRPVDAEAVAGRLDETHPEAEANREQIRDALLEEGAAAGVAIESSNTAAEGTDDPENPKAQISPFRRGPAHSVEVVYRRR
jgi:hypothetical protein